MCLPPMFTHTAAGCLLDTACDPSWAARLAQTTRRPPPTISLRLSRHKSSCVFRKALRFYHNKRTDSQPPSVSLINWLRSRPIDHPPGGSQDRVSASSAGFQPRPVRHRFSAIRRPPMPPPLGRLMLAVNSSISSSPGWIPRRCPGVLLGLSRAPARGRDVA